MQQSLYYYNNYVIDHSSYLSPSESGHENPKILGKGDDLKKACEQNQNVEDKIQKSKGNETFFIFSILAIIKTDTVFVA